MKKNKVKKNLYVCILVFLIAAGVSILGFFSERPEDVVEGIIEDAILYTVNEEEKLEYNVVCEKYVIPNVKVTGCEIEDLDELKKIMGAVDFPEPDMIPPK